MIFFVCSRFIYRTCQHLRQSLQDKRPLMDVRANILRTVFIDQIDYCEQKLPTAKDKSKRVSPVCTDYICAWAVPVRIFCKSFLIQTSCERMTQHRIQTINHGSMWWISTGHCHNTSRKREASVRAAGCHSFTSCLRFSYFPFHFRLLSSNPSSAASSSSLLWYMIWYNCQLQMGSHPVAVVQYTLHTNST